MAEKKVLLTQEAYDKLKQELAWREGDYREEITERIAAARAEGDLSENGGYQAAREAQSKNEGRINELTVKLRNAEILTPPPAGTVGDGSIVKVKMMGRERVFVLGSRELSVSTDYDVISPEAPLGAAVDGHHVGDEVSFDAPNGRTLTVTVVEAKPLV